MSEWRFLIRVFVKSVRSSLTDFQILEFARMSNVWSQSSELVVYSYRLMNLLKRNFLATYEKQLKKEQLESTRPRKLYEDLPLLDEVVKFYEVNTDT